MGGSAPDSAEAALEPRLLDLAAEAGLDFSRDCDGAGWWVRPSSSSARCHGLNSSARPPGEILCALTDLLTNSRNAVPSPGGAHS